MKKVFWLIYAVLNIAIILLSVYYLISNNAFSILSIFSSVFSIIYLIGLFGYIFEKRVWTAVIWRRFFYLICFGTALMFTVGVFSSIEHALIDAIFGSVFSIPMIFALYQYSKAEQRFWINTEENTKGNIISALMDKVPELEIEKQLGLARAKVQITKDCNQYTVKITRVTADEQESFKNTFSHPGQLAIFIEQYTFIKVADFESKYA
ncbi:hypothetical protein [Rheinheimera sp. EpRS3]|uniref:hypothetical protein n=1 Tax=Rheinheimera sp. EpRS3 TaxID=1712383 RepID=UPI0007483120|nr:hypothetical protein [Rheinheimera sp. EpRS3]KUM51544.1 hypothetical protein AR688_00370 [Rheinheimera sp. EpRS3]